MFSYEEAILLFHLHGIEMDLSAVDVHQTIRFHFPQFSCHGAAVNAEIIGKGAERKGNEDFVFSRFHALQAEVTQEFFPDGTVGKNLHFFAELLHFFRHKRKEVFYHQTVMMTGAAASFGDVAGVDEYNGAGFFADGNDLAPVKKGEERAEDTSVCEVFQHVQIAVSPKAVQGNAARKEDAHFSFHGNLLFFPKCAVFHFKTGFHLIQFFRKDAGKERIFQ